MWKGITQPPLTEIPSSSQPYGTNEINMVSEQPMPVIPILNTNSSGMNNNSMDNHFQEMMPTPMPMPMPMPMPIPSSDAIATNNHSNQISMMLGNRRRNQGHRRFNSEIPTLSNYGYFGGSFGSTSDVANAAGNDVFTFDETDDETIPKLFDSYEPSFSSATAKFQVGKQTNANLSAPVPSLPPPPPTPAARGSFDAGTSTHRRENPTHKRSQSMVETSDVSRTQMHCSAVDFSIPEGSKKHISPDELDEIFQLDPSRAKRILANRRAAAKLKERKSKYKAELEDKVQFLQSQVESLHKQLDKMKREASGLIAANKELRLRMQAIEQNFPLQGALNEVLIGEIEHLKLLTDLASNSGMGQEQQFYLNYNNSPMQGVLTVQQLQQLHMNSQPQQHTQQQQTQDSNSVGNMDNME